MISGSSGSGNPDRSVLGAELDSTLPDPKQSRSGFVEMGKQPGRNNPVSWLGGLGASALFRTCLPWAPEKGFGFSGQDGDADW